MSHTVPRRRRAPARKTFRRIGWTLAGGLVLLGAGLPALGPARLAPRADSALAATSTTAHVATASADVLSRAEDLAAAGRFAEAAALADQVPAVPREALLADTLHLWSLADPAAAARRALAEPDAALRARLLRTVGLSSGEGAQAPALAAFAAGLEDPAARHALLDAGLPPWVEQDPAAAFAWLAAQPASPELDAGRAALAGRLDRLTSHVAAVADEAERITDPARRRSAFAEVLSTWHLFNPSGAAGRLARSQAFDDLERAHLMETLAETPALL